MADRPIAPPPPPPPYLGPKRDPGLLCQGPGPGAQSPEPSAERDASSPCSTVHSELAAIYRAVDAEIRALAPQCNQRGLCCDFDRTDHALYASSVEIGYVKAHTDEARRRRPTGNVCPFLVEGSCTAREARMLGCRTYYCQEGWEPHGAEVYERAYARIRALAQAHGLAWRYGPALEQLREA